MARRVTINPEPEFYEMDNPIEEVFDKLGYYHWYIGVFSFISKLFIGWHYMSFIFIFANMDYNCISEDEDSPNIRNHCPCDNKSWIRDVFDETIISRFSLVCEKKNSGLLIKSSFFVGLIIGSLAIGSLSDRYGRLFSCTLSAILLCLSSVLVAFMQEIISLTLLRLIQGFAAGGYMVANYVLLLEQCGKGHRELVSAFCCHIPFNLGHMILPGMAYALRHYGELQIALTIPSFLLCFYQCLMYPSPKWLLASGKIDLATTYLNEISKFNGVPIENLKERMLQMELYYEDRRKSAMWSVVRNKKLCIYLVGMSLNAFSSGFGFLGVSKVISEIPGNIFINVAISGGFLVVSTFVSMLALMSVGRKPLLILADGIGAASMLTLLVLPDEYNQTRVYVATIGNCSFFAVFVIIFLYCVELFPTVVRNVALGFVNVVVMMGMTVAQYLEYLPRNMEFILIGSFSVLGGVSCIFLPETKGKYLAI